MEARNAPRRRYDREPPDSYPNTPPKRRILVTGYPSYTQPHDLVEVFAKFGNVRVDQCSSWAATLTFPSEREAGAALGGRRLLLHGQPLAARAWSAARAARAARAPRAPAKRDFPMSKQKGVIIDPKQIGLRGDFHSQLDNILAAVRLTQEDVKALSQLYSDLEAALQMQWPGCKAVPFGSITTGLGIKTSDADCFISIPGQFRQQNGNAVNKAKRVLMQCPDNFAEILAIPRANTPIVKFFHIPTATNCDVTFKTPLGAQNSRLIAFLLHSDPRLLPMAVLVKYWAKVHDLSGTGKLTNYALTLMIIFYLQQLPMSILPAVAWLQAEPAESFVVDYWDTGFMNNPAALPASSNTSSIAELLGGFYEYYSKFNFDELVICPYFGAPIKKEFFKNPASLPAVFERYKNNVMNNYVMPIRYQTSICVQDPFEQCHNVASTITSRLAADLKAYFNFAADAYEKDKLNGCQEFLRTILIEKPKLLRGKTHPEYRVNLFPRIINTIITFDWKVVVRNLVMEIFENLLKIKLDKVEDVTVNPDTRKEKEKYTGFLMKAIWKRKAFSKLYSSILNLTFDERQEKITEEIINADKHEFSVQFLLTLTFCNDPKSAVIAIRLGQGDLSHFREFGKFFISVMQNWFTQMLKHFLLTNCKDTGAHIDDSMELENNENGIDTEDEENDESTHSSKTQPDDQELASNKTKATVERNSEEAATNNLVDTLTAHTDERFTNVLTQNSMTLTGNNENLTDNAETFSNKNNITLPLKPATVPETAKTLSENAENVTDSTVFRNAETLSESAGTLTANAENLNENSETLNKDAATFIKTAEALLKALNINGSPTANVGEVTFACAHK